MSRQLKVQNLGLTKLLNTRKHEHKKKRQNYQDTPGSLSIYQNAPGSSKFTKLPLSPKKYTL